MASERIQITDYNYLLFSWEQTAMDAQSGQSTVAYKIELVADNYGGIISSSTKRLQVYINGANTAFEFVDVAISNNSSKTLYEDTRTFTHNSDGTCTFSWAVKLGLNITWGSTEIGEVSGSGIVTLEPVIFAASITTTTNFTDEENPVLNYYNPAGENIPNLRACVKYRNEYSALKTLVDYEAVSKAVNGSHTFVLTDEERETIRNASKNSKTLNVVFVLESTLADNIIETKTSEKIVTIVNAEPVVNPSVNDDAGYAIIRDHDSVTVSCNATPQKGATIVSYKITNGGKSVTESTGVFDSITNDTFYFTVTDSRGFTTTVPYTVDLVPYIALTCNVTTELSDIFVNDQGREVVTTTFNISGKFYAGSMMDGGSDNALVMYFDNGGWDIYLGPDWTSDISTSTEIWSGDKVIDYDNNTYTARIEITQTPDVVAWIHLVAYDNIKTIEYERILGPEYKPVFDWSKEDFNFNVPVTISGATVPSIIESGTFNVYPYDTFYYRKWSDGLSECWGRKSFSVTFQNTNWGELSTTGPIAGSNIAFPEGLFIETPCVDAQLMSRSVGGILMVPGGSGTTASSTQTGPYEIARATYIGGLNNAFTISYYVRGTWK